MAMKRLIEEFRYWRGPWPEDHRALDFVWFVWRERLLPLVCRVRGRHSYEPNGCDYVDSGGEGFTCTRCGRSFTAWH
jgi:hypothetical protein